MCKHESGWSRSKTDLIHQKGDQILGAHLSCSDFSVTFIVYIVELVKRWNLWEYLATVHILMLLLPMENTNIKLSTVKLNWNILMLNDCMFFKALNGVLSAISLSAMNPSKWISNYRWAVYTMTRHFTRLVKTRQGLKTKTGWPNKK